MTRSEITIVALAAFVTVTMWLFVIGYVLGLYFGVCFPGDPEYPCPTKTQKVLGPVVSIGAALLITYFGWRALARAGNFRRDR